MISIVRNVFYVLFIMLLVSCGKDSDEKRESAKLSARILMTQRQYSDAIEVLESVGRKSTDVDYMILLATAYAGRGGFDSLTMYETDIPLIGSPAPLGGVARFSTSDDMTTATDSDYEDVRSAIEILLYTGGLETDVSPTSTLRTSALGADDTLDVEMALMYMLLTNLGRYFRYYGNANSAGVKGEGTLGNNCFLNYSNIDFDYAVTSVSDYEFDNMSDFLTNLGLGSNCDSLNDGSDELGTQGDLNIERLCEGAMLVNNFLHILPNILGNISGTDFDAIADIQDEISTAVSQVNLHLSGAGDAVADVLSQELCESRNSTTTDNLETYFAMVMEALIL